MGVIAQMMALCQATIHEYLPEEHKHLALDAITLESPRHKGQGELACNAALLLAKPLGKPPMELAENLCVLLRKDARIVQAQSAKPGFINLTVLPDVWQQEIRDILRMGPAYARNTAEHPSAICVEYVSANPTGPIHVGHARGAVVGDVLANLLAYVGHKVQRSYYINDVGEQIHALARSVLWRLQEQRGMVKPPMPEGLYTGAYLSSYAKSLMSDLPSDFWKQTQTQQLDILAPKAVAYFMEQIHTDLSSMGVTHSDFISEAELRRRGLLEQAQQALEAKALIYKGVLPAPKGKVPSQKHQAKPQLLFRAKSLGDDEDRALQRPNGAWTYFAADIACHSYKYDAGYTQLINIWGADHGGYVKRLELALQALYGDKLMLHVKLCHLVRLMRDGAQVKMSKRGGEFISLRDLIDEVGADVIRFIMLTRRHDAPLDFDFTLVKQKSKDNPVFYVQYAHARICSVLRQAQAQGWTTNELEASKLAQADMTLLVHPMELALMRELAQFPRMLAGAALSQEPHRLAFYAQNLASHLHMLWSEGKDDKALRFLHDDKALTQARLSLLRATAFILHENLSMMGITPLEEMH